MTDVDHKQALPSGFDLEAFRLLEVLGVGGFGVTYLAHDPKLDRRVAIKEYLPNEFAVREGTTVLPKSRSDREDFAWGLARFLDEARTLARFRHPNLVRVVEYFEANRTAYIVMDYEDGEPLDRLLDRHGALLEAQLKRVLLPVVEGLEQVHAAGYLHRDIKPSNVFVRRADESPVLLDFGAARQALGRKSKSLTAVASAGYSPPEQYESEGEQGSWTDVYALSALCYRAITGDVPIEAPRRQSRLLRGQSDPQPKLTDLAPAGYSRPLLEAVDAGLRVVETEPRGSHWERCATPRVQARSAASGGSGTLHHGREYRWRSVIRHRISPAKGCLTRRTMLSMIYELGTNAERHRGHRRHQGRRMTNPSNTRFDTVARTTGPCGRVLCTTRSFGPDSGKRRESAHPGVRLGGGANDENQSVAGSKIAKSLDGDSSPTFATRVWMSLFSADSGGLRTHKRSAASKFTG